MRNLFRSLGVIIMITINSTAEAQTNLPVGFVFLHDVDPTIIENVRYYTNENFLNKRVPGYEVNKIICTSEAAQKLKAVHDTLKQYKYKLVVYDGFRPQRSVNAFIEWQKEPDNKNAKIKYYPTVDKKDLFQLGYICEKSGHSRGSTFDLTIIPNNQHLKTPLIARRRLQNNEEIPFLNDNTVDMGSSFDLFHEVSHHDTPLITKEQTKMRNFLRQIMNQHGFKEYPKEWWHYTLDNEPFSHTYFDFTVTNQQ
jgi:D-alanyl-D-alanine dipeptidase